MNNEEISNIMGSPIQSSEHKTSDYTETNHQRDTEPGNPTKKKKVYNITPKTTRAQGNSKSYLEKDF